MADASALPLHLEVLLALPQESKVQLTARLPEATPVEGRFGREIENEKD